MEAINEKVTSSINLSINYLLSQIKDNGQFIYRINMNPIVNVKQKYNWLRHAGTLYSMISYAKRSKNLGIADQLLSSITYMMETAIFPVKNVPGCYAVWTTYEKGFEKKYSRLNVAKLGGAGLALVALLEYESYISGSIDGDVLIGLGQFICYMQKDNGGFYSKYIVNKGGKSDQWVSLYYPGEAALGLIYLYEYTQNVSWLKNAERALLFLARSRRHAISVEADHWALLATERILLYGKDLNKDTYDQLVFHAKQICQTMMAQQIRKHSNNNLIGCFDIQGRTTPTSTRLEGLLAVVDMFSDSSFSQEIEETIHLGKVFLLNSQIIEGKFSGAMPRAFLNKSGLNFIQNDARCSEVRIDYVQHFLSAMMAYHDKYVLSGLVLQENNSCPNEER